MNRLIIPNGGMPFTGDDLLWLQSGLAGGVAGITQYLSLSTPFNDGSVILDRVLFTIGASDVIITEGVVVLENEVCHFPGVTAFGAALEMDKWWIVKEIAYDPQGMDVFADLVAKDTYEIRRATVAMSETIPESGAIRLDLHHSYRINTVYPVQNSELFNSWVNGATPFAIHKRNGIIFFTGGITAGTTNLTAFTIPEAFLPIGPKSFVLRSNSPADQTMYTCVILPSGEMTIWTESEQSAANTINLSGVIYPQLT